MRDPRFLIEWTLIVVLLAAVDCAAAESAHNDSAPSFATQSEGRTDSSLPASQPGDSTTLNLPAEQPSGATALEIAPQHSDQPRDPDQKQTPGERKYQPSENNARADADSDQAEDGHLPYLGIELEYTTQCYLGMEEHGFEVVNIDPDSPAARAGMQGRTEGTRLGDLGVVASLIALPVSFFTIPMMRRAGTLGMPGDLIIAVDDQRVRTPAQMIRALDHLKPGDTAYITALRAVPGGTHQTIRFMLHIDREVRIVK